MLASLAGMVAVVRAYHVACCLATSAPLFFLGSAAQPRDPFVREFSVAAGELASSGRNPYFVLEPGYKTTFAAGDEQLTITVLNETKIVDGVETRVIEERETKGGAPVETSRNYFAISKRTRDVYYFGEDVDVYRNGKIAGHEGAWRSGVGGARFGLMMPGVPVVGAKYYHEIAPNVAMDRAQILSMTDRRMSRGIMYSSVMKVEETTPLEPRHREYKWYVPGLGLIADGTLELVRVSSSDVAKP